MAVVALAIPTLGILAATVKIIATPSTPPNQVYQGAPTSLLKLPSPTIGKSTRATMVPTIWTRKVVSHKPAILPKAEFNEPCKAISAPANAAVSSAMILPVKIPPPVSFTPLVSADRGTSYPWKGFFAPPRNR